MTKFFNEKKVMEKERKKLLRKKSNEINLIFNITF